MAKRLVYQGYEGFPEEDETLYEIMRNMTPTERFNVCLKRMREAIELNKPNWDNLEWYVLRKRKKS
jgi:hypothetical protein